MEFLGEEFVNALVCGVFLVEEINHDHVVLLPVAVAATDALLYALGVPREVVVDDERAELEVDTLRSSFGRDHDPAFVAEIVHQCGAHVSGAGAGDVIRALVSGNPPGVNFLRAIIGVAAIEEHDAILPLAVREQAQQVFLGAA